MNMYTGLDVYEHPDGGFIKDPPAGGSITGVGIVEPPR
jgi:hypothetical protein